jgi:hypothetical protein
VTFPLRLVTFPGFLIVYSHSAEDISSSSSGNADTVSCEAVKSSSRPSKSWPQLSQFSLALIWLEVIGFRKPIINPDVMIGALYIFSVIVQIPMVAELNVNRSLLVDYSQA